MYTTYNNFLLHLSRFKTQKKNLKIKPVMPDDTGIYICKGTNGFGSEEIRIDLIVIGKFNKCFGYSLECHNSLICTMASNLIFSISFRNNNIHKISVAAELS